MLVLMPGNQSRREILFVQDRNPAQEHWTGRLLSVEEARLQTGVDTVLVSSQFEPFVAAMLTRRSYGPSTPCRPRDSSTRCRQDGAACVSRSRTARTSATR